MTLEFQKRLAADLMKCGTSRVRFDPERLDEIESAITRAEIKNLIGKRCNLQAGQERHQLRQEIREEKERAGKQRRG
jgi:large subunit ribosomal protein L19e